jgi:hypothetical protein
MKQRKYTDLLLVNSKFFQGMRFMLINPQFFYVASSRTWYTNLFPVSIKTAQINTRIKITMAVQAKVKSNNVQVQREHRQRIFPAKKLQPKLYVFIKSLKEKEWPLSIILHDIENLIQHNITTS